jgi:cardiolipin synthase A/B
VQKLKERAEAGVQIRVIGSLRKPISGVEVRQSHPLRLHTRAIVRDAEYVFLGSQSLCRLELDLRREVGVVFRDPDVASRIANVFGEDWKSAKVAQLPAEKVAIKVAKAIAKDLTPVAPVLEEVAAKNGKHIDVDPQGLQQVVKEAVKSAVRDVVHETVIQESTETP